MSSLWDSKLTANHRRDFPTSTHGGLRHERLTAPVSLKLQHLCSSVGRRSVLPTFILSMTWFCCFSFHHAELVSLLSGLAQGLWNNGPSQPLELQTCLPNSCCQWPCRSEKLPRLYSACQRCKSMFRHLTAG